MVEVALAAELLDFVRVVCRRNIGGSPVVPLGDVEPRLQIVVVAGARSAGHYVRAASEDTGLRGFRFLQRRADGGLGHDSWLGRQGSSVFPSK